MNVLHLVKMANDIGAFFESDPDPSKGAKAVADHIRNFWDPRMRREILNYIDREPQSKLKDIVVRALINHRQELSVGIH